MTVHEEARDLARALSKTEAFAQSRKDRKKVEMLFGHMSTIWFVARHSIQLSYGRGF